MGPSFYKEPAHGGHIGRRRQIHSCQLQDPGAAQVSAAVTGCQGLILPQLRPQVQGLVRRSAVCDPVQRVDRKDLGPGGIGQTGARRHLGLAVKAHDHPKVRLPGGWLKLRIGRDHLLGQGPAQAIGRDKLLLGRLLSEIFLHQAVDHIGPLGKARQDDGSALVFMLQIIGNFSHKISSVFIKFKVHSRSKIRKHITLKISQ